MTVGGGPIKASPGTYSAVGGGPPAPVVQPYGAPGAPGGTSPDQAYTGLLAAGDIGVPGDQAASAQGNWIVGACARCRPEVSGKRG